MTSDLARISIDNRCLGLAAQIVCVRNEAQRVFVWHLKQAIMEPTERPVPGLDPELYTVAEIAYHPLRLGPTIIGQGDHAEEAISDYLQKKRTSEWVCPFVFVNGAGLVRPLRMPYRWEGEGYVDLTCEECSRRAIWPMGCRVPGNVTPEEFWKSIEGDPTYFASGGYDALLHDELPLVPLALLK